MIRVNIRGIAIDGITGMPIVLLSDAENEKDIYPIWIGVSEAEGIVINQSNLKPPRPLTYDLFKNIIENLGGTIKAVEIVDKVENVYTANIVLEKDKKEIYIDARPSDAINLAIRFNAPIYLNEEVVQKINLEDIPTQTEPQKGKVQEFKAEKSESITDEDIENFKKLLENIKPDDFLINKDRAV